MPLKTPPKPKTKTPATAAKVTATPAAVPPKYQNAYDRAKLELANAKVFVKVATQVADAAKKRLVASKVDRYYTGTNMVYLYVDSTFPHNSLNDNHWLQGTDPKLSYIDGLNSNDITQVTGTNWAQIKYSWSNVPIVGITNLKPSATLYSVNKSLPGRKEFAEHEWDKAVKKAGYKALASKNDPTSTLGYYDMPTDDAGSHSNGGPLSVQGWFGMGGGDDVEWAYKLHRYVATCQAWQVQAQTNFDKAKTALNDAKKALGIKPDATNTTDDKTGKGNGKGNGKGDGKGDDKGNKGNSGNTGVGDDTQPVVYNLPGAKDLYFRNNDKAVFVTNGNTPLIVSEAMDLWNKVDGGNSKGMIQSYIVPGAANFDKQTNFYQPGDTLKGKRNINLRRYGFQFTYNPSTVTMDYSGAPQVDIGLETSGLDKVNLIGAGVTSSTVSFQLLLNRMNDMKYIHSILSPSVTDSVVIDGEPVKSEPAKLGFFDVYSHTGNHPASHDKKYNTNSVTEELRRIRELGTMYDVEYLLRTLIGYELQSSMRGNMWSSDIGYLGAYPVELHLGKNLRYLVTIDSFNLSHTIFTVDMVPVFTNLTITCNRLPDFAKRFNETSIVTVPKK